MIYGDGADGQDSSRLNAYTSRPDIHAMMQSGNGYVYGLNNPNLYKDSTGLAVHPAAAAALPTTYLVVITGSKKHGVKWKERKARAKKENEAQGQWAEEDLDFATEKAKTLAPRESAEFDLPEDSQSIVHMPNGTTQKATKMWIRNNGSGTWHGYPKP